MQNPIKMNINPRTGKGWTDAEELTFADIMRIGRMGRIAAIQLFRRCKSDHAKALKLAQDNYGLSDAQVAGFERTKAARLAGLSTANARRAQDRPIIRAEVAACDELRRVGLSGLGGNSGGFEAHKVEGD